METLKDWMETIDDINNHRKDNGEETRDFVSISAHSSFISK